MRTALAALALALAASALAADGVSGHLRTVSQSGFGAYEATLAAMGSGFVAAWYDTRHGHAELYARMLDAEGAPIGPERRLTVGTMDAYEPDVATAGDLMIVAWYERESPNAYRAMVGAWARDGREKWRRQLSTSSGRNPLVRVHGNEAFCAWLELSPSGSPEVRVQWLDLDGEPRGLARAVAPSGRTTWNLNAALGEGGVAWVVFDAEMATRTNELFLARIDREHVTVRRLTADDGNASRYPDIALQGGRAAVTWFDERDGNQEVYLLVSPLAGLQGEVDARASRVTRTRGDSIGAYVAWSGGRVGLAWCDNTSGQHEIYFEPFDANGRPTAPPRRITDNPTQSMIPAIRPARRGFALAWNEVAPGPAGGHDPRSRSEIAVSLVR